jgi:hypothetical protein
MRLYVARWPNGTAMVVSAESMADVADRLDELGDPGTCEVVQLDVPLALVVRPAREQRGAMFLETSLDALDDAIDVERAIMSAVFPRLSEVVEQSRDAGGRAHVSRDAWRNAIEREKGRELAPSAAWARAVGEWWEEMSGGRPDETAAARDHMRVTIPGEPEPHQSAAPAFEAERRRIRKRIDAALGLDGSPAPSAKRTEPPVARPKTKTPRVGPSRRR